MKKKTSSYASRMFVDRTTFVQYEIHFSLFVVLSILKPIAEIADIFHAQGKTWLQLIPKNDCLPHEVHDFQL